MPDLKTFQDSTGASSVTDAARGAVVKSCNQAYRDVCVLLECRKMVDKGKGQVLPCALGKRSAPFPSDPLFSRCTEICGLCRTVRGPSMSANVGKVQVLGATEVAGENVIELRFIQGRNLDWAHRPFFARYDDTAIWLKDLQPAFGEKRFFFEDELESFYRQELDTSMAEDYV